MPGSFEHLRQPITTTNKENSLHKLSLIIHLNSVQLNLSSLNLLSSLVLLQPNPFYRQFHFSVILTCICLLLVHTFIYFWRAPLWLCSTKRKHQSPEWTILSHVNCFIQGEVQWLQVLLGSLHPRSTGTSLWSPPVLQGEAVKICLASDSSGIHAMWPSRKRRRAWTAAERCGCSVFRLTSSFHT